MFLTIIILCEKINSLELLTNRGSLFVIFVAYLQKNSDLYITENGEYEAMSVRHF